MGKLIFKTIFRIYPVEIRKIKLQIPIPSNIFIKSNSQRKYIMIKFCAIFLSLILAPHLAADTNTSEYAFDDNLFKLEAPVVEATYRKEFASFLLSELQQYLPGCDADRLREAAGMMAYYDTTAPAPLRVSRKDSEEEKEIFIAWNRWARQPRHLKNQESVRNLWKSPWCAVIFAYWGNDRGNDAFERYMNLVVDNRDKPELQRYLWNLGDNTAAAKRWEFLESLPGERKVSPWYEVMCKATREVQLAWQSRGTGWAKDVTEEGWDGFSKHLSDAVIEYRKACELRPDWPEPYVRLVGIVGATGDEKQMQAILKEAVSKQVDNRVFFDNVFNYRMARWGGSPEELKALAILCLKADIPDSRLGDFGIRGLFEAYLDNGDYCSSFGFEPENLPLVRKALDGIDRQGIYSRNKCYLLRAFLEYAFGNFEEAFKAFEKSNPKQFSTNRNDRLFARGFRWMNLYDAQIAMQGTHGKEFIEAELTRRAGKEKQAMLMLLALLSKPDLTAQEKDYAATQYGFIKAKREITYADTRFSILYTLTAKSTEGKYMPLVKELLQLGVDPNGRPGNKASYPLHDMISADYPVETIKLMIEHGANLEAKASNGRTPLDHARARKKTEVIQLLESYGQK